MVETERLINMGKTVPLIVALFTATLSFAQISYKWTAVPIDSTWDEMKDPSATQVIERYKPQIGPLQEIVGYTVEEYSKHRPESALSNLSADMVKEIVESESGEKVDIALINFGGIRTDLPKGAVRVYDLYSIFPFENTLVYFDIKGSDLKSVLLGMIKRGRVEALSNVKIVVRDGVPLQLDVAGAPIDEERIYRLATINFLMDGGDGLKLRNYAENYVDTGLLLRDAFASYFRENFLNPGKPVRLSADGRVTIENHLEK